MISQFEALATLAMNEPLLGDNNFYTEVIAGAASGSRTRSPAASRCR